MLIGILTCHRGHNYGALMQAYAIKTYLKTLGHEVEFIDYLPSGYFSESGNIKPKKIQGLSLKEILLYPKYFFRWFYPLYALKSKRRKSFHKFIKKYIIDKRYGILNKEYDVVIYGSDQIWSKFPQISGFDQIFFGDKVIKAKKRISLSASMGVVEINDNDIEFLRNSLNGFYAISVREDDLFKAILLLKLDSKIKLCKTIDPAFLLEQVDWDKLISHKIISNPYLLYYNFQGDPETNSISKFIADSLKLQIITIAGGVYNKDIEEGHLLTAGPLEFLSLFRYADFIVSSSFHGVAFSIIFEKQFYARQTWNCERVKSLLRALSLEDRFLNTREDINLKKMINFEAVHKILSHEKQFLKDYLQNAINPN